VIDEVLPVSFQSLQLAKEIVLEYQRLSARDAVHLAIVEQHGIGRILSFDSGFDIFPGVTRIC